MNSSFKIDGSQKIDIPCPNCAKKIPITIGQAKASPDLKCPSCGTPFRLDASKFKKDIDAAEQLIGGLGRDLAKMFKK